MFIVCLISIWLLVLVSSSACAESKVLDEKRAKVLIKAGLQSQGYMASPGSIVPLMSRSVNDYTTDSSGGNASILRQLIAAGFVTQSATVMSYPNVSGSWAYDHSQYGGSVIDTYTLQLQMVSGSNAITGTGEHYKHGSGVGSAYRKGTVDDPYTGSVNGTVSPDGMVSLNTDGDIFPGFSGRSDSFQYNEEGQTAFLRQVHNNYMVYTGEILEKLNLKSYEYAFSPKMGLTSAGVVVGRIEIGEVSNLQLTIETHAVARFAWHVSLNQVGLILLDGVAPNGIGSAQFAKKPDGTWVLASSPRL